MLPLLLYLTQGLLQCSTTFTSPFAFVPSSITSTGRLCVCAKEKAKLSLLTQRRATLESPIPCVKCYRIAKQVGFESRNHTILGKVFSLAFFACFWKSLIASDFVHHNSLAISAPPPLLPRGRQATKAPFNTIERWFIHAPFLGQHIPSGQGRSCRVDRAVSSVAGVCGLAGKRNPLP